MQPHGQLVNMDVRESRMRLMAHELADNGLHIPGLVSHPQDTATPSPMSPKDHHSVAASEKQFFDLREWQRESPHDPAVQVRRSQMMFRLPSSYNASLIRRLCRF